MNYELYGEFLCVAGINHPRHFEIFANRILMGTPATSPDLDVITYIADLYKRYLGISSPAQLEKLARYTLTSGDTIH